MADLMAMMQVKATTTLTQTLANFINQYEEYCQFLQYFQKHYLQGDQLKALHRGRIDGRRMERYNS
jgi:hypothetical protein